MIGLTMLKEYADEILSGDKSFDARAYNTLKRGRIAIVDSRRNVILGTVVLTGTRRITAEEYIRWHKTGKWADCTFDADPDGKYYAYDFIDPVKFDEPIVIERNGRTWCSFEDDIVHKRNEQTKFF